MRIPATLLVLACILLSSFTVEAQVLPADNIIMRVRQVCNQGNGGSLTAAFEIKPRTNMWPPNYGRIGGFSVVFTFTSTKLVFNGAQQRYNPNYWGGAFRSAAFGSSAWFSQHASTGNPNNALPVSNQYFSQSTDCTGNPLNDEFFEIMRYAMTIQPTANGTVDLGLYDIQPYNTSMYLQEVQMTAIFSPDLMTNLNDSVRLATNLIIPVELVGFNVTGRADGSSMLTWRTETETENLGFEVERGDGVNFERIGFVSGRGTTTEAHDYTFVDESPVSTREDRIVFYRLKQVDLDGSYAYSDIHSTQIMPGFVGLEATYPNPASSGISVVIPYSLAVPAVVTLHVYNALGKRVAVLQDQSDRQPGRHVVMWNTLDEFGQSLPSGAYFVRFDASVGNETIRGMRQLFLVR
jgi:hypothetical protein